MYGSEFVPLTLPPLVIAILAALACAGPGNYLILRRQAMLGDAMSHVVLPGIVAAFLLSGSAAPPILLAGALCAAALSAGLIEVIRRLGGTDPGAAMGITFTAMFAAGVLMLELSGAASVHLDVEHALYGNLEGLIWIDATGWASLLDPAALAGLPPELPALGLVALAILLALKLASRPLAIATFDEGFACSLGLPVRLISAGLVALTALAAVAAFSAVGSILTIAMLICPPATARLLTDDLGRQIRLSLGIATAAATLGTLAAGYGPPLLGLSFTVSASGMIATVSGVFLALAATLSPRRHGHAPRV
ncbi:zinc ABC transporter permease [Gemmobacter aquarius]|uniref:Zinc ABC transporter permease n=1 Tax=Paragemmobacter aquarius TaxID=2169400 RepID=A0A2S0UJC2_9RHOB|nr:metal ABC transporter permease [Gemmobacter aquarius]AWB47830.1 zinc ABC transporter permease [Gemmobacter aquarius]